MKMQTGLKLDITVTLWNRDTQTAVASLVFSTTDQGTLDGTVRWKTLDTAIVLSAGFHGMISASGYGATEAYYGTPAPTWTPNDGDGALTFLADGKWGVTPGVYPNGGDLGYGAATGVLAAGNFAYTLVPEPATMSLLGLGGLGLLIRRKRK